MIYFLKGASMLNFYDQIFLSENVVREFYNVYNSSPTFKKEILKILPQIEDCEKQKQNNPWHKYNVLDHILHSIKHMNSLSNHLPEKDRKILAYTMLFHDIGKPACHIVREKNGKQIDSFFNHNIESARIAKEVAPKFGFSEEETAIIEKLVYKHDIFMFIKPYPVSNPHWRQLTYRLINQEARDLNSVGDGIRLLKMLVMVGRADTMAQNEAMTTFDLFDKFEVMIDNYSFNEKE